MSSGPFSFNSFSLFFTPPTPSHHHHFPIYSIIDSDSYEHCYELMWLQQCIKDACISQIWTRASLTRDSSHCLLSVSKLFVFEITPEQTRFSLNSLHSPLKESNIYISIDLRTVWTIGSFYIKHTLSQIHYLLLPWSFCALQDDSLTKRPHTSSVDTQDWYLQLLSATPAPKSISHPTIRHLFPITRQLI